MPSKEKQRLVLLQGTLDVMILRVLATMGPQHSYAISTRLEQLADQLMSVNQGNLYPALVRVEQNGWISGKWQTTDSGREAKYYSLTKARQEGFGSGDGEMVPLRGFRESGSSGRVVDHGPLA